MKQMGLGALALGITLAIVGCHGGECPEMPSGPNHVQLSQGGLPGDLDNDGAPGVSDAITILRMVVGLEPVSYQADCDGDGAVTVGDAIVMLRCLVGLAAWPLGANGRIAFCGDASGALQIYSCRPDGNSLVRLTHSGDRERYPRWSRDGLKLCFMRIRDSKQHLWTMDANGENEQQITDGEYSEYWPAWSPDGTKIVYSRSAGAKLIVIDADGSSPVTIFEQPELATYPDWSPDGTRIVFCWYNGTKWDLWTCKPDASDLQQITSDDDRDLYPEYSPDGTTIVYGSEVDSDDMDIYTIPATGGARTRITDGPLEYRDPSWSPDGSHIACYTTDGDNFDVVVMDADGSNQQPITTNAGLDYYASWTR